MHFIRRVKLPDGTVYEKGQPFPKFVAGDEDTPYIISDITVAPKSSEDVGDEEGTAVEERDWSVELWAGALPKDQDAFLQAGATICHRIMPTGVRVEEFWTLDSALDVIRDRSEVDVEIEEDEPEAPVQQSVQAPAPG